MLDLKISGNQPFNFTSKPVQQLREQACIERDDEEVEFDVSTLFHFAYMQTPIKNPQLSNGSNETYWNYTTVMMSLKKIGDEYHGGERRSPFEDDLAEESPVRQKNVNERVGIEPVNN